jgi:hypothetical protein
MGDICSVDLLHKGPTHDLGRIEWDRASFHHNAWNGTYFKTF